MSGQIHSQQTRDKLRAIALSRPSPLIGRHGITKAIYEAAMSAGMLWCRDCKQFKFPQDFGKARSRCSQCNREKSKSYRDRIKLDPEAYRVSVEKIRAAKSQGREGRKMRNRRKVLARYKVTPEWYDLKLVEQNGVCALCFGRADTPHNGSYCIDHAHDTGKLRGLLCHRCNTALERFEIDGWNERAMVYLARYRE